MSGNLFGSLLCLYTLSTMVSSYREFQQID